MIDPDSQEPPYRQLAADLRRRIAAGEYTGRLPSEKDLAHEYEVAQGTVRKALGVLRDEGLIITNAGWGSFVKGDSGTPGQD